MYIFSYFTADRVSMTVSQVVDKALGGVSLNTSKDMSYLPRVAAIIHVLNSVLKSLLMMEPIDVPLQIPRMMIVGAQYLYTNCVKQRALYIEVSIKKHLLYSVSYMCFLIKIGLK